MNIYVHDKGWRGAIVVVAESREQASEKSEDVVSPDDWSEYSLDDVVYTVGDH